MIIVLREKGSQGDMGWVASEKWGEAQTASGDVGLYNELERAFCPELDR
jgi:hypothetical protein